MYSSNFRSRHHCRRSHPDHPQTLFVFRLLMKLNLIALCWLTCLPVWASLPLVSGFPGDHSWPMRGFDAQKSSFSAAVGPEDPSQLPPWPFQAAGPIYSSPVVDRGSRSYFGSEDGSIYALHAAAAQTAGLLDWRFATQDAVRFSPALATDMEGLTLVYAGDESGTVYALRGRDGSLRWSIQLGGPVSSSLVTTGGGTEVWIYLKVGSSLVALRDDTSANTVTKEWSTTLGPSTPFDNPPAVDVVGSRVAVTDGSMQLQVFDAQLGLTICPGTSLAGSPSSPMFDDEGRIYITSEAQGQGVLEGFSIETAGFGFYCKLQFTTALGSRALSAPVLGPDQLVLTHSKTELIGVDRISGARRFAEPTLWAARTESEPVVDGAGRVYLTGLDRKIHAYRVDISGARQVWEFLTDQHGAMSPPAIDNLGRLHVASADHHLYVLQENPAFQIAFDTDLAQTSDLELHTLRDIYGRLDPITRPWARVVRLTLDPMEDLQAAYSTDGRLLAWTAGSPGSPTDVVLAAAGARDGVVITADDGTGKPFTASSAESDPAFTPVRPDGTSALPDRRHYLAFSGDDTDLLTLQFMDLRKLAVTGNRTVLDFREWLALQFNLSINDPLLNSLVPSGETHSQVAFSSDGDRMAYSACSFSNGVADLRLVSLQLRGAGLSRQVLASTPISGTCRQALALGYSPSFAPDGSSFVYHDPFGGLRIHDFVGNRSVILPAPNGIKPMNPSWSPDGTEIAARDGGGFGSGAMDLHVFQGALYQNAANLTAPLAHGGSRLDRPEYHPTRLPEPLLVTDCRNPNGSPFILQPQEARPGEVVEVYGCGFDIRVPERNRVEMVHAQQTSLRVAGRVLDARVDLDTGLGVLRVVVPYLAGNGPVTVATPFGRFESGAQVEDCRDADSTNNAGCFTVAPLTTTLLQPETVIGAKIRVLGYGFQFPTTAPGGPLWNRVLFTDAAGRQTVPGQVTAVRLEACDTSMTPCPQIAPRGSDGIRRVEWLEVIVPTGTHPGPVSVVSPSNLANSHSCCTLGLLEPQISVTPNNGSEGQGGNPGQAMGPTFFDMEGIGFPYDPYFGYDRVQPAQISSDGISRVAFAQQSALQPEPGQGHRGTFTQRNLAVQPDPTSQGGMMAMEAQSVGNPARATTPFRTPKRGLPVVFIPGTSGTFISNNGGAFTGSSCSETYPAGGDIWMSCDTVSKILTLKLLGINLTGCQEYLTEALALRSTADVPNPGFGAIGPASVIERVDLGCLRSQGAFWQDDFSLYEDFFDFMTDPASSGGLARARGNNSTGACSSAAGDCVYAFGMDWRMGYESEAARLSQLVEGIHNNTGREVVIVTHSMGSMVADYYLRTRAQAPQRVDQIVSLGGGYLGVPLPYQILQKGDDWGLSKAFLGTGYEPVSKDNIQKLAQNWPTAYWQSPGHAWFTDPNDVCDDGDCSLIWEDGWDVDGDGRCGSTDTDVTHPCDSRVAPRGFVGKHHGPGKTLSFMRNAPHDGCPGNCDGDPSQPGDQVNVFKFDLARAGVLGTGSPDTRECSLLGRNHRAAMGDWRCGTDGVFFHRVVGSGVDTVGRMRFHKASICARPSTASALIGGLSYYNPLALFGCAIKEERREVIPLDGDATVPLRSTVGILDGFDDRVWGIDWRTADDEVARYGGDEGTFHRFMPSDPRVHALLRALFGGRITNLSQMPVPRDDGSPYFRIARGNPAPTPGSPAFNALCGSGAGCNTTSNLTAGATKSGLGSVAQAKAGGGSEWIEADRFRISVSGDLDLHIVDQKGRHVGPKQDPFSWESIPGVTYSRNDNGTWVSLPKAVGAVYQIELRHGGATDGAGIAVREAGSLTLEAASGQEVLRRDVFHGIPFDRATLAIGLFDPEAGAIELELDYAGDGQTVTLEPAVLLGDGIDDQDRPRTELTVKSGELTLDSTDEGSGVDYVLYGFDRNRRVPRVYDGPVQLPPGVRHVWAYAVDHAGNTELPQTWDEPSCEEGPFGLCVVDLIPRLELMEGVVRAGETIVIGVELENRGESVSFAPSLRLALDPRIAAVTHVEIEGSECIDGAGTVLCDLEILEPGQVSMLKVEVEILKGENLVYRLETLVGEHLSNSEGATLSGVLESDG